MPGVAPWSVVSLGALACTTLENPDRSRERLTFTDLSLQVVSVLIDYGDNEIFIDGGMGSNVAWKYIKNLVQDPIELAIITHGDTDHWKGMARVLGLEPTPKTPRFRVTEFWEPGYDRDCNVGQASRFLRPLAGIHVPMVQQSSPSSTTFVTLLDRLHGRLREREPRQAAADKVMNFKQPHSLSSSAPVQR